MSILLPAIDLTSAVVGQKVHVPLFQQGLPSTQQMGTLQMHNDSGVGLNVVTDTAADQIFLSAGQWREIKVSPGESGFTYQVVYVLQNPPVSTLSLVYYYPGETVNDLGALGNSPIGGSVAASNAISVTNTGFPAFNVFIFGQAAGDTDNLGSVSINNAGQIVLGDRNYSGFLSVQELTNSGRGVLVWTRADSSELELFANGMDMFNATGVQVYIVDSTGSITCANGQSKITFGPSNETHIVNLQGSDIVFQSPLSTELFRIINTGIVKAKGYLGNNGIGTLHFGQILDTDTMDTDNNGNTYFKSAASSNPSVNIQPTSGTTVVQFTPSDMRTQNGATWNHQSSGTALSGGTSGTATLFQDCTGNIKRVLIVLNNFRTAASAQTIALPVAFTSGCIIRTGNIGTSATNAGVALLHSATQQSMQIFTALATAGTAGTTVSSPTAFIYAGSFGECESAFDTVQFQSGGTAGHTGFIELVGQ